MLSLSEYTDLASSTAVTCVVLLGGTPGSGQAALQRALLSIERRQANASIANRGGANTSWAVEPLRPLLADKGLSDLMAEADALARPHRIGITADLVVGLLPAASGKLPADVETKMQIPAFLASPHPVLLWCAGCLSGARRVVQQVLAPLLIARHLLNGLLTAQLDASGTASAAVRSTVGKSAPGAKGAGVALGGLVLTVVDDMASDSRDAVATRIKAWLNTALKGASCPTLADDYIRVAVIPATSLDDGGSAFSPHFEAAAVDALELAIAVFANACRGLDAPQGSRAAADASEVDLDNLDGDDDVQRLSPAAVSIAPAPPREPFQMVYASTLKQRFTATPAILQRGFPLPQCAHTTTTVSLQQPSNRARATFLAEDATLALKSHLRRHTDSRVALALSEADDERTGTKVPEVPRFDAAWSAAVLNEATTIGRAIEDRFFGVENSAAAAEARSLYQEKARDAIAAHEHHLRREVVLGKMRQTASTLSDAIEAAMDALLTVQRSRG